VGQLLTHDVDYGAVVGVVCVVGAVSAEGTVGVCTYLFAMKKEFLHVQCAPPRSFH